MENKISYTVTSSTGEEFFKDIPVEEALLNIKKSIKEESKWLFIDQDQETAETVNIEKLLAGSVITLTDMLGGG